MVDSQSDKTAPGALTGDWSTGGDFLSAVLAGLGIGWAGDYFLGTEPWLVVAGIVSGSVVGFWRMVIYSNRIVEQASNPRLAAIARTRAEQQLHGEHVGT